MDVPHTCLRTNQLIIEAISCFETSAKGSWKVPCKVVVLWIPESVGDITAKTLGAPQRVDDCGETTLAERTEKCSETVKHSTKKAQFRVLWQWIRGVKVGAR